MRCACVGMWGIRHDKAPGSTTVPDLAPLNNTRVSRNGLKANVRSPEAKLNRSCPRSPSQNASNTEITIRVASALHDRKTKRSKEQSLQPRALY